MACDPGGIDAHLLRRTISRLRHPEGETAIVSHDIDTPFAFEQRFGIELMPWQREIVLFEFQSSTSWPREPLVRGGSAMAFTPEPATPPSGPAGTSTVGDDRHHTEKK